MEHILKHSFQYSHNGDLVEAKVISMSGPGYEQLANHTIVEQAFLQAVSEVSKGVEAKEADKSGDSDISASDAIKLMLGWSGDVNKVYVACQEIFRAIALIDGEEPLTVPLLKKMHLEDYKLLVGGYIANFIMPSLMDGD